MRSSELGFLVLCGEARLGHNFGSGAHIYDSPVTPHDAQATLQLYFHPSAPVALKGHADVPELSSGHAASIVKHHFVYLWQGDVRQEQHGMV